MSLSETDVRASTFPTSTSSELSTSSGASNSNTEPTATKSTITSSESPLFFSSSVSSSSRTPSIRPSTIIPRPTSTSRSHAESSSQTTASSTEPTSFSSSSQTLISTSDARAEPTVTMSPMTTALASATGPWDNHLCATRNTTITICVGRGTFGIIAKTITVPLGTARFATVIMTTVSSAIKPATTLPVQPSVTPPPTRPRPPVVVPTAATDSNGNLLATLSVTAQIIPTFSVATDSRSSVATTSYNLTTLIVPQPGTSYGVTTWTTYTIVGGSTIPLVADQTVVPTTSQGTYIFEPGTTIPLSVASSISVESTRTSLSSATAEASQIGSSRGSEVAGAVVGTLVGLTFLCILIWVSLRNRRKQFAPDYAASQSAMWGSRSAQGSGSNGSSVLNLNREPSPRASFVEPWIQRQQTQPRSRKIKREMEERGGVIVSGPSSIGFSAEHSYDALRPSNSANRVPPELQPEPLMTWPVRNNPLSSIHSAEGSELSFAQHLSDRSPFFTTQSPSLTQFLTVPQLPPPEPIGQAQRDAIPPMYNEAWNARLAPPS